MVMSRDCYSNMGIDERTNQQTREKEKREREGRQRNLGEETDRAERKRCSANRW